MTEKTLYHYSITFLLGLMFALWGVIYTPLVARATNITVTAGVANTQANDGQCSLREAIIAANLNTASGLAAGECPAGNVGIDVITLPAGTYILTGTLDINGGSLTINGAAATTTILDGNNLYRVLNITTGGSVSLNNLTIRNGRMSSGNGAGINNGNGALALQNMLITNNSVLTGDGGGIYNGSGGMTVISSTISNNSALTSGGYDGGGIYNNSGTVTVMASTLSGNSVSGNGGGIYNNNGTVTLNNSTLATNSAQDSGGGIAQAGTTLNLNSSTLILNTANADLNSSGDGGGVYIGAGTANIRNTLIAGNTDLGGSNNYPDFAGTAAINIGNLLGDLTGSSGFSASDVAGVALTAIVNTTPTGSPAVYALTTNSPAIDRGASDSTSCPSPDQRGQARPQGPTCDTGAYEVAQAFNLSITKNVTAAPAPPIVPGQIITYSITFRNNGPYTATGVMITDTLPAELDPASVSTVFSGVTMTSTLGPPATTLAWQVQHLGSGQSGSLTIAGAVMATATTDFTNTIIITGANGETTPADNLATRTIALTIPQVSLSSAAYSASEGAGVLSVTLNLNRTPQTTTTVNYATSDGTATNPADYMAASGTATFNPGQTSQIVAITLNDDTLAELSETFTITLSSPVRAFMGSISTATVTITDNDPAKILLTQSGGSSTIAEGGATDSYDVVLNGPPTSNVVITISPDGQSLVAPNLLTFTAATWNMSQNVTLTAIDDSAVEGNHTTTIAHSAASSDTRFNGGGAIFTVDTVTRTTVTATITDNENGFTVSRSHVSVTEGNTGSTPITFTVTKVGSISTVSYTLNIGSNATAGLDYQNLAIDGAPASPQGTINFPLTATTALISLDIVGDLLDEPDEVIQVIISTYDYTTTTIIDDDTAGVTALQISGNTFENGNLTNFPIVLTSQPTNTVTLNLVSSDTTEGTLAPASLTFNATNWNIPQVVTMTGVDDTLFDGNITYTLNVASITSLDLQYASLTPGAIAFITNIDDETISNLPPTITLATTAITTPENTATPAIPLTLADDNTPVANLVITLTSSNPALVPNSNIVLGGSGANRTVTATPAANQSGTAVIQIQVADSDGGISNAFIIMTVTPNNQPPIANNNTISTPENTAIMIAILGNDTDSDGTIDPTSVTITSYPTHGSLTLNADGSVLYTPAAQFSGSDSFTYRVNDDDGATSNVGMVFIAVTPFNDPPILATPIPDQTSGVNTLWSYTIPNNTFTDIDNAVLTYTARLADGTPLPSWLSFNNRTFSGTVPLSGTWTIEVTASDGTHNATDIFLLTATLPTNRNPVLLAPLPDVTASAGQPLSFNVSPNFSDPDNDPLTFTVKRLDGQPLPTWLSFNPNTGLLSGTPPLNAPTQAYVIQITASDGKSSALDNFILTIQGSTPTPTVTTTATITPELGGISGLVRGIDNTLLSNINVLIDRLNGTTWELSVAETTTISNGQYQINNLMAGTYRLYFIDTSGNYASLYYLNTSNPEAATPVTVIANQTTPSINMVLPFTHTPVITVSGSVATGRDGQVVAWPGSSLNLDSQVQCASGARPSQVQVGIGNAVYTMTMQSATRYSTTLGIPTPLATAGYHDLQMLWLCDGFPQSKAFGRLYISLYDPSGQVTDAVTSKPISGATVTLYRLPNATPDSSATQRDGACRVDGAWQNEPAAALNLSQQVIPVSGVISPTLNPEITGTDGRFAWEVVSGCWYVYAEAAGYTAKTSPLVGVPPYVTHLNLALNPTNMPLRRYLPVVRK